MRLCAFTSVCEEDAEHVPRYLAEMERLQLSFGIHFDRCSPEFKQHFRGHPLLAAETDQDDPAIEFNEQHKQRIFDKVYRLKPDWTVAVDIDETWERGAAPKIAEILDSAWDCVDIRWVNLWNDPKQIRIDRHYETGHRVKFLALRGRCWVFDHPITNGAKLRQNGKLVPRHRTRIGRRLDLVCIHWGMLTRKMRLLHLERWNRIYTTAVGDNPYGFWKDACDESVVTTLESHDYF